MSKLDDAIRNLMRETTRTAILPRFRNLAEGEIEDKGGGDPVTIADRDSEAFLSESLARLEPGLAIVGEEAVHEDASVLDALQGDCWIVDPIDGTRNFARGEPPFGILIARASGGLPQSGWIYDCLSERFCSAHLGKGAFMDGERIASRPTGQKPPVAAISLSFLDPARREAMRSHVSPHYECVDIPWCAAEQYPRLVLGENDVSIFERTLPWDHAAGTLWLNEAGGKAARLDGSAYRVDDGRSGMIGAATPHLWDELADRLRAF